MDTSFDLVALLKERPVAKTHKVKPTQFVSVAGGVQKRLETNIKYRKSSRLSVFDRIRNIQKCDSPLKSVLTDAQQKAEYRKQQLEKWKEEKEKKKKELAAQKKKPFVTGASVKSAFGPPPPPKPMPSTSGRVTRSQARLKNEPKPNPQVPSFAPKNACFKPQFEASEMPILAKPKKKPSKVNFTFEPIPPKSIPKVDSSRSTRSRAATLKPIESKETHQKNTKTKPPPKNVVSKPPPKNVVSKPPPRNVVSKPPPLRKQMFQSSSSSDMEKQVTKPKQTNISKPQTNSTSDSDGMTKPHISKKTSMFSSSSSSDSDGMMKSHISKKTSMFSSSSSSDSDGMTKAHISEKTSMFTSSSSSDIDVDQALPNDITMSNKSSSSDSDQQMSKRQDTMSTSQESTSENEIEVMHTPKTKVPKSESSSEEKLRSPNLQLTPEQIVEEANNISPCVTLSRGKSNARLEMKRKLDEGLLDEDNSNMESIEHLRRQMNSEIARMTALCEAWDKVFAQTELPVAVQELVLTAVGQARLLMSQKMQQFAGLVESCARPAPGAALITPADLQGFWDMLFMQVENVDMRFKKLDELRASDWVEPQAAPAAKRQAARAVPKKAKPSAGPSRLRDMIAAARKAKKQQESQPSSEQENPEPPQECKTFDAGFFSVSSPLKQPGSAPATPANKSSLLKAVLSSEARKASASKNSASFAMLRAAKMGKNMDIEGISPLMDTPKPAPPNLFATPARSILKSANPISSKKPDRIKTVLFHESDDGSSPLSFASCADKPEVKEVEEVEEVQEVEEVGVKEVEKENVPARRRRSSRLSRQNAEERPSPILTRSARGNNQTVENTPRRSTRRRKSAAAV